MNIFYLDNDYKYIPPMMIDAHVSKMILETAQLLCSCHDNAPYKKTHYNHPCAKWVRQSKTNYIWLCNLGLAIGEEFEYRRGKTHKSIEVIKWCLDHIPNIPDGTFSQPPQAMPDTYKDKDAVKAYRNYYRYEKTKDKNGKRMDKWTKRNAPNWWI